MFQLLLLRGVMFSHYLLGKLVSVTFLFPPTGLFFREEPPKFSLSFFIKSLVVIIPNYSRNHMEMNVSFSVMDLCMAIRACRRVNISNCSALLAVGNLCIIAH